MKDEDDEASGIIELFRTLRIFQKLSCVLESVTCIPAGKSQCCIPISEIPHEKLVK